MAPSYACAKVGFTCNQLVPSRSKTGAKYSFSAQLHIWFLRGGCTIPTLSGSDVSQQRISGGIPRRVAQIYPNKCSRTYCHLECLDIHPEKLVLKNCRSKLRKNILQTASQIHTADCFAKTYCRLLRKNTLCRLLRKNILQTASHKHTADCFAKTYCRLLRKNILQTASHKHTADCFVTT